MRAKVREFLDWSSETERHGVIPASDADDKVSELFDGEADTLERGTIVIDYAGRIFFEGVHVGWVRCEADFTELSAFADCLGVTLPPQQNMKTVRESE